MPSSPLVGDILKHQKNGFISYDIHNKLSKKYSISHYEIEKTALENDIIPLRYKRNSNTLNSKQQLILLTSKVAIVGCGGLGGHISELLARVGVGNLLLMDFDKFDEHNLNRQNYSTLDSIGKYKVEVAKEFIYKINPSVNVVTCKEKFSGEFERFLNYDLVVDALDNPKLKLLLARETLKNKKHFVHGAIGGFNAQFTTDSTLENLYRDDSKGSEIYLGNLSFMASFAASVQASEIIKLLLDTGESLKNRILFTDLLDNEFFIV